MRDTLGGGVGLRRPEGIVDVELGERSERLRQGRVVLGLARLEAAVLQEQHFAGLEVSGHRGDLVADHRRRLLHGRAEQLAEPFSDLGHREFRIRTFGPTQMRDEHHARAALAHTDRGERALMRVSSVTIPSPGTFRSARTRRGDHLPRRL
jgi:hypothetical protein